MCLDNLVATELTRPDKVAKEENSCTLPKSISDHLQPPPRMHCGYDEAHGYPMLSSRVDCAVVLLLANRLTHRQASEVRLGPRIWNAMVRDAIT